MNQKINITSQLIFITIGIFIPFIGMYPFYKIKKLTKIIIIRVIAMLVTIVPIAIAVSIDPEYIFTSIYPLVAVYLVIIILIEYPFIIRWTREWNEKTGSAAI